MVAPCLKHFLSWNTMYILQKLLTLCSSVDAFLLAWQYYMFRAAAYITIRSALGPCVCDVSCVSQPVWNTFRKCKSSPLTATAFVFRLTPTVRKMLHQWFSSFQFDNIHSAHSDWIKFFIHDTNKCTFNTYKYIPIIGPTRF